MEETKQLAPEKNLENWEISKVIVNLGIFGLPREQVENKIDDCFRDRSTSRQLLIESLMDEIQPKETSGNRSYLKLFTIH